MPASGYRGIVVHPDWMYCRLVGLIMEKRAIPMAAYTFPFILALALRAVLTESLGKIASNWALVREWRIRRAGYGYPFESLVFDFI